MIKITFLANNDNCLGYMKGEIDVQPLLVVSSDLIEPGSG